MLSPDEGAEVTGDGDTRDIGPADEAVATDAADAPKVGRGEAALLTGDGGDEQFTVELLY